MVTNGVEVDGLCDGTREGSAKYDLLHFKASRRFDFFAWGGIYMGLSTLNPM